MGAPETVSFEGQLIGWSTQDLSAPSGVFTQIFWVEKKIWVFRYSWRLKGHHHDLPKAVAFHTESLPSPEGIFPPDLLKDITWHLAEPHGHMLRILIERPFPNLRAHRLAPIVSQATGAPCPYVPLCGWDRWDPKDAEGGILHLVAPFHGGPLRMMKDLELAWKDGVIPKILVIPPHHWQALRIFQQMHLAGEMMKVFPTDREFVAGPLKEDSDAAIRGDVTQRMAAAPHFQVWSTIVPISRTSDAFEYLRDLGPGGEEVLPGDMEAWVMAEAWLQR